MINVSRSRAVRPARFAARSNVASAMIVIDGNVYA
jgi:hypothetical protein